MKSLSALEAEQWITIRSIFLIDLPFHSFSFSLPTEEKQDFQCNLQNLVNHNFSFLQVIHLQVSRINDADVFTGLNGRIGSFLLPSIATGTGTATGAAATATTGASAITASSRSRRILGDEFEDHVIVPATCGGRAVVGKPQRIIDLETEVDTSNIPHRTVLFLFHAGTSKRGIENPQAVNLHLIPRYEHLLHRADKGLHHVLHILHRKRTDRLDLTRQRPDRIKFRFPRLGFEHIHHRRFVITNLFSALIAHHRHCCHTEFVLKKRRTFSLSVGETKIRQRTGDFPDYDGLRRTMTG
ncbi:hypothetical protein DXB21_07290 [Bacteroides faecis]|nr:hypothetical protein DXB21_07290 [Bacteroides faecis]